MSGYEKVNDIREFKLILEERLDAKGKAVEYALMFWLDGHGDGHGEYDKEYAAELFGKITVAAHKMIHTNDVGRKATEMAADVGETYGQLEHANVCWAAKALDLTELRAMMKATGYPYESLAETFMAAAAALIKEELFEEEANG